MRLPIGTSWGTPEIDAFLGVILPWDYYPCVYWRKSSKPIEAIHFSLSKDVEKYELLLVNIMFKFFACTNHS